MKKYFAILFILIAGSLGSCKKFLNEKQVANLTQDYYKTELTKLGWSSSFSMPGNDTVAVQVYQKDSDLLTVTITNVNDSVVVVLTMG